MARNLTKGHDIGGGMRMSRGWPTYSGRRAGRLHQQASPFRAGICRLIHNTGRLTRMVEILDCTLRDGGNGWCRFWQEATVKIIEALIDGGIRVIEWERCSGVGGSSSG